MEGNYIEIVGHVWAQVCIDNEWIVADPTNTLLFGNYSSPSYINMGKFAIFSFNIS